MIRPTCASGRLAPQACASSFRLHRDTSSNGSGTVTGPVDIKVRNVGSGKETTFPAGFRYIAKMQITAFGPGTGTAFGGTRVTVDGVGFNDPLASLWLYIQTCSRATRCRKPN